MTQPILMNVKEVSYMLSVTPNTIYTMVKNNQIPHVKIRGKIMFNKQLVEDWTKYPHKYELEEVK